MPGQPDKFLAMGASASKGILLRGRPGCGRTLLAWGLAGESDVSSALPGTDRVGKPSIVARGHAGGLTCWVPEVSVTRTHLLDRIAAILGGRVAEDVVTGDLSMGPVSDLDAAVSLARHVVTRLRNGDRLSPFTVRPLVTEP